MLSSQAPRPSPFGQATESAEQSREDEANEDNDLTSLLSTNLSQPTDGDDGSELDTVPWPIIAPNMIKPGYAPDAAQLLTSTAATSCCSGGSVLLW